MSATVPAEQDTPTIEGADVWFHLSLNVGDLARSVEFFRRFFGVEPAKQHADYAKFELREPPLVLSLGARRPAGIGALNHLGFRLSDAQALVETQRRLETVGIRTQREEGVECCHSTQTKFWVHDPDGNLWEVYTLDAERAACDSSGAAESALPVIQSSPAQPRDAGPAHAIWAHRLDQRLPSSILAHAQSVDQVQLLGTFNADVAPAAIAALLAEVVRVLKEGGEVLTHILVADAPLPREPLALPGMASLVAVAPQATEVIDLVTAAGLAQVEITALAPAPNFIVGGVALRECKLRAVKPTRAADSESATVIYRGPFAELRDESGHTFERGQPTAVDAATAARLRNSSAADQFVFCDES